MTYPFSETTLVKDVVNMVPKTSDIFKKNRIDFCCGGAISIQQAADERNVELESIMTELKVIHDKDEQGEDGIKRWLDADSESLVNHIKNKYHRSLNEELQLLSPYVTKVARVHGDNHPHLKRVRDLFVELRDELRAHTKEEEDTIFPLLLQLNEVTDPQEKEKTTNYIAELEKEHEHAATILEELRDITNDYTPPAGACGTYQLVYRRLESLEGETFIHVHLENNILFPRFI